MGRRLALTAAAIGALILLSGCIRVPIPPPPPEEHASVDPIMDPLLPLSTQGSGLIAARISVGATGTATTEQGNVELRFPVWVDGWLAEAAIPAFLETGESKGASASLEDSVVAGYAASGRPVIAAVTRTGGKLRVTGVEPIVPPMLETRSVRGVLAPGADGIVWITSEIASVEGTHGVGTMVATPVRWARGVEVRFRLTIAYDGATTYVANGVSSSLAQQLAVTPALLSAGRFQLRVHRNADRLYAESVRLVSR